MTQFNSATQMPDGRPYRSLRLDASPVYRTETGLFGIRIAAGKRRGESFWAVTGPAGTGWSYYADAAFQVAPEMVEIVGREGGHAYSRIMPREDATPAALQALADAEQHGA